MKRPQQEFFMKFEQVQASKDKEQEFRDILLGKKLVNMHMKFFEESMLDYITVPIITKFSGNKPIVPFRNKKCSKPECVFDIDELVSKFRETMLNSSHRFICFYCKKLIDFADFFLDETLANIITIV